MKTRLLIAFSSTIFSSALLNATITATPQISPVSPQPVGTPVTVTFGATDSNPGPVNYQLEVKPPNGNYHVVHNFDLEAAFTWAQSLSEGTYQLRVTARDNASGQTSQVVTSYVITSRVTGTAGTAVPVVTATIHPLVALLSAPACPSGSSVKAAYSIHGSGAVSYTNTKPCGSGSANFLVGGLYPTVAYDMNYVVTAPNGQVTKGPSGVSFTAGTVPKSFKLTQISEPVAATAATSSTEKYLLSSYAGTSWPYATDLYGHVIWYYNGQSNIACQIHRLLPGGTILTVSGNPNASTGTGAWGNQSKYQLLQEIDLAGNIVRETNADRVNEQLPVSEDKITHFNHDSVRLPNGHTLAIATIQRVFPANTQGNTAPIDVVGTMVLDLDPNFAVTWYWNSFEHDGGGTQLDITRAAVLGEQCSYDVIGNTDNGCPPVLLTSPANDWLHSNSLQYEPDGSILLSMRNQDWVLDIDYGNGAGTGNILWRLGPDGDFTMQTAGSYPWFSHQHNPEFQLGGMTELTVFDNGNTRVQTFSGNSRGMSLSVDVPNRLVSVLVSQDMGTFSEGLGSAQKLSNGDYGFLSGDDTASDPGKNVSWSNEYGSSGTEVYSQEAIVAAYRSFRVKDLYTPPNGAGANTNLR